jgi:MFS family permease
MRIITRTVWILSVVSLFADIASEMLYPVIPVYLKQIGFTVLWIGMLEGLANFTAGISKGYFGKLSDEKGIRLPFIKLGYFLSAVSKPMMAVFSFPIWIFLARTIDRLGKGIRTSARDAMLSQEATKDTKARVFGFHRGMDTVGATLGPALAFLFLWLYPGQYKLIFYFAFIPGIISVLVIFLLHEKKQPVSTLGRGNFFSFFKYWNIATPEYKKLIIGLLFFAVVNSSDVFLLLKTKEVTGSDSMTILAYIFYNLVFALGSYPLGVLGDRFSLKKIFMAGLIVFTVVYAGFAFAKSIAIIFTLFFLYGIYAAATEGITKAWITNIAHDKDTATAVGFYTSCQSIGALLASVIAGFLWNISGSTVTFIVTAASSLGISVYFLMMPLKKLRLSAK